MAVCSCHKQACDLDCSGRNRESALPSGKVMVSGCDGTQQIAGDEGYLEELLEPDMESGSFEIQA